MRPTPVRRHRQRQNGSLVDRLLAMLRESGGMSAATIMAAESWKQATLSHAVYLARNSGISIAIEGHGAGAIYRLTTPEELAVEGYAPKGLCIAFRKMTRRLQTIKLRVIGQANKIIDEYRDKGIRMTLRQLFYQFVARVLLDNADQRYDTLGDYLTDGRDFGLVAWDGIEDNTRDVIEVPTWGSPEKFLDAVVPQFALNPWHSQPTWVEVWLEKSALESVAAPICAKWRVPLFSCRGNASTTSIFDAGFKRLKQKSHKQKILILYFGDHDPSGWMMSLNVQGRLNMYAGEEHLNGRNENGSIISAKDTGAIKVVRIALNRDQIEELNPPPNPAKETDSNIKDYNNKHPWANGMSWELDALPPDVIVDLIDNAIKAEVDQDAWDAVIEAEEEGKAKLADIKIFQIARAQERLRR